MKRMVFSLKVERTPYQGRYFYIRAWAAPQAECCEWPGARYRSTYTSNGVTGNRHGAEGCIPSKFGMKCAHPTPWRNDRRGLENSGHGMPCPYEVYARASWGAACCAPTK